MLLEKLPVYELILLLNTLEELVLSACSTFWLPIIGTLEDLQSLAPCVLMIPLGDEN